MSRLTVVSMYGVLLLTVSLSVKAEPAEIQFEIEKLERRQEGSQNVLFWDSNLSIGTERHAVAFYFEGDQIWRDSDSNAKVETDHRYRLLYTHQLTADWNFLAGGRADEINDKERYRGELGLQGLLPLGIESEYNLMLGSSRRVSLEVNFYRRIQLYGNIMLDAEVDLSFINKDDPVLRQGEGLAEVDTGLRLGYLFHPQFMPYVGYYVEKKFDGTATFAEQRGEPDLKKQWLVGFQAWF